MWSGVYGFAVHALAAGGLLWVAMAWVAVVDGDNPAQSVGYWIQLALALFGGVLAIAVPPELDAHPAGLAWVASAVVFVYVLVLEAALWACLDSGHVSVWALVVTTALSYLPVRLSLAMGDGANPADVLSGLVAYGVFCWQLITG